MAIKRRRHGQQGTRSWALLVGLSALLLPAPAFANLAQQVGYSATAFLESFPAIMWSVRGLAGLFGIVLIVAGFRLYMRLVPVLGGAFLAMVGYDLGIMFMDSGWPLAIIGAVAGFALAYFSHRAVFCLIGAFPGYVLGLYWTGHILGGIGGAVLTGLLTMAFFNFGLVAVTSILGSMLLSFAITGHLEPWVVIYPAIVGIVIQGTTFPETLVACKKPLFIMPWRRSNESRFKPYLSADRDSIRSAPTLDGMNRLEPDNRLNS